MGKTAERTIVSQIRLSVGPVSRCVFAVERDFACSAIAIVCCAWRGCDSSVSYSVIFSCSV